MKEYYIAQSSNEPWPAGGGKVFNDKQEAIEFCNSPNDLDTDSVITVVIVSQEAAQ